MLSFPYIFLIFAYSLFRCLPFQIPIHVFFSIFLNNTIREPDNNKTCCTAVFYCSFNCSPLRTAKNSTVLQVYNSIYSIDHHLLWFRQMLHQEYISLGYQCTLSLTTRQDIGDCFILSVYLLKDAVVLKSAVQSVRNYCSIFIYHFNFLKWYTSYDFCWNNAGVFVSGTWLFPIPLSVFQLYPHRLTLW